MILLVILSLMGLLLSSQATIDGDQPAVKWGDWPHWGDQCDGTYRNPVLPCDYSDIDCIRVGSDYYAISSTFQFSPGMVILHSRDLVNWTIAGHVIDDITQIGPEMNWDRMDRYGHGVWAGAIRFHDKKFWVYFGTPHEGYFMATASNPKGPWTPLHQVLKEPGWDDCCPFWDDDGQGYLVGTHFADNYKITLWKLTADGRDLVPGSGMIIHQSHGSEANKLFKINGIYYHLFSEVNSEGRVVMMERSNNIYGPYNECKQLNYADRPFNEPNQGGLVQTEQGKWYWFTHHGTGDWEGRSASLLPVTWVDGWPILGAPDNHQIGHFVWGGQKPVPGAAIVMPGTSDDFHEKALPAQWEWNYQPRADKWSLKERPGWLRLHAFPPIEKDNFLKAGNTLTQRVFRTGSSDVVIKMDLSGMANGQKAGLCHFSESYSLFGVCQVDGVRTIEYRCGSTVTTGPQINGNDLWLKSIWGLDGVSRFSYSTDGKTYTPFGDPYPLKWGFYRGDRIGIYCYNHDCEAGYIDIDYFHYTHDRTR